MNAPPYDTANRNGAGCSASIRARLADLEEPCDIERCGAPVSHVEHRVLRNGSGLTVRLCARHAARFAQLRDRSRRL